MLKTAFILFLLLLFPLIGGGVVISSIQMLGTAGAMRQWPTVPGKVLSCEVAVEMSRNWGQGGRRGGQPVEVYSPHVVYEYVVDGKTYRGDRIAFANVASTDRHQAELTVQRFDRPQVDVYFDPQDPQASLLDPDDVGGIIPGIIIGSLLMIVPPALIVIGLRSGHISLPEMPLLLRLWWSRFSKSSSLEREHSSEHPAPGTSSEASELGDKVVAGADNLMETVVCWQPGRRVEVVTSPTSFRTHLLLAAIAGFVVALAATFPITHAIYRRDRPHFPELRAVFLVMFASASSLAFLVSRLSERRSHAVIDWTAGEIVTRRDFRSPQRNSIGQVRRVVIEPVVVGQRPRRFRAMINLDLGESQVMFARTSEARRKPQSAREKAAQLGEPLADALGVPLACESWES